MKRSHQGRRAVLLARCSTPQQVEYSVPRQLIDMRHYCRENGIDVVSEVKLEGVSGLDPYARTDIDDIAARKVAGEDFDLVLVATVDRLTRGGPKHGFWILQELEFAGVELASARNDIPEDDTGWISLGLKFHEANAEVHGIVKRFVEGYTLSVLDGRNVHSPVTPYGLDRLYYTVKGQQIQRLHRIRNLEDGRQWMLHADRDEVLREFGPIIDERESPHYRRQAGELITFIPGDPERVETVRTIFKLRFIDGWMGYRIAAYLNDRGVRTSRGARWFETSVGHILENTTYTGLGIANRRSGENIRKRGYRNGPISMVAEKRLDVLRARGKKTRLKERFRDQAEWLFVEYPHLIAFLDNLTPETRRTIRQFQREEYEHLAELQKRKDKRGDRKSGGNPHLGSPFILTKLIKVKQDNGGGMTGKPGGYRRKNGLTCGNYRVYSRTRANVAPGKDCPRVNLRAELLEGEVLRCAAHVIGDIDRLRPTIREAATKLASGDATKGAESSQHLVRRRADLLKQIHATTAAHKDLSAEDIESMTVQDKKEIRRIDALLERTRKPANASVDTSAIAERVVSRLKDLPSLILSKPAAHQLRAIVLLLVRRMEFDAETYVMSIDFAVPSSAIRSGAGTTDELLRLVPTLHTQCGDKTYWENSVFLGSFAGKYHQTDNRWHPPTFSFKPTTRRSAG